MNRRRRARVSGGESATGLLHRGQRGLGLCQRSCAQIDARGLGGDRDRLAGRRVSARALFCAGLTRTVSCTRPPIRTFCAFESSSSTISSSTPSTRFASARLISARSATALASWVWVSGNGAPRSNDADAQGRIDSPAADKVRGEPTCSSRARRSRSWVKFRASSSRAAGGHGRRERQGELPEFLLARRRPDGRLRPAGSASLGLDPTRRGLLLAALEEHAIAREDAGDGRSGPLR